MRLSSEGKRHHLGQTAGNVVGNIFKVAPVREINH